MQNELNSTSSPTKHVLNQLHHEYNLQEESRAIYLGIPCCCRTTV